MWKNFEEEAYLYMHQSTTHDLNTFTCVHSEKPEKVKKSRDCSDCGKTFLRKDKFDNHVRVHHKNEAPLETCKDCDHKFTKSDDLERHVNTVHDRIKKVTSKAGLGTFVSNEKGESSKTVSLQ